MTVVDQQLEWQRAPDPTPGRREVVVRVRAAGLNGADMLQVQGLYPAPAGAPPDIPGLELAGEVIEIGSAVTRFGPGDRVMAVVAGGGQAELAVVHERHLLPVPEGLSWEEAGGFPEVFTTAFDALFTQCELLIGERVCVHGAAGGVGTAGVQLAVAAGAGCRLATVPRSRSPGRRGSSRCHRRHAGGLRRPRTVRRRARVMGAPNLPGDLESLATGGRVAVIGVGGGAKTELSLLALMGKRARIHGSTLRARSLEEKATVARAVERHVVPLLSHDVVRVPVAGTFSMGDAGEAYERFRSGGKFGKIVLLVGG
ncbi:MAG: alcohol dehydrogenase catalytic domain-containing protein [Acidimicrobiia bacterium]|nr:alcohol dehydrogenase catalytic domain-containing protein [Acidimicrobiia bacterium]